MAETFWDDCDEAFYQRLHDGRPQTHAAFTRWWSTVSASAIGPLRVLEVGCGIAVHYPAAVFPDEFYHGRDLSPVVAVRNDRRDQNPRHSYSAGDIATVPAPGRFDVVFSLAAIDHVPNVPAFLAGCVRALVPGGHLYVNAYRGWHPEITAHRHGRGPDGCLYNDLAPALIAARLRSLGLADVYVGPGATVSTDLGPELVATGRMP